jgi:hypothetical protein
VGKHVADAESAFKCTNINPDFCKVNGKVVPFDIYQILPPEKSAYSADVLARGEKVLKVGSLTAGVVGNAGEGVASTVSQGDGHSMSMIGDNTVLVNGCQIIRHNDLCIMNCKVG